MDGYYWVTIFRMSHAKMMQDRVKVVNQHLTRLFQTIEGMLELIDESYEVVKYRANLYQPLLATHHERSPTINDNL